MKSLFPCFKYPFFHRLFGSVTSEFLFLPPKTLIDAGATRSSEARHPAGFWDLPRAQPPRQEGKPGGMAALAGPGCLSLETLSSPAAFK